MTKNVEETRNPQAPATPKVVPRLVKASEVAQRTAREAVREAQVTPSTLKRPVLAAVRPPRGAAEARAAFAALFGEQDRLEKRAS
jgi:hypothetical protein